MGMSNAIDWDVQSTGSNNNGGGFKQGATGNDYSTVGATPQATLSALSVVGASTSDIMVSTIDYVVVSTDVGNIVQITGGTATAGFYEIQNFTTGITGTQKWTVDRSCGTAAQTIVGAMGGSLATPNKIMAQTTATGGPLPGHKIHVKSGTTYTGATSITQATAGDTTNGQISLIGYQNTHGDEGNPCVINCSGSAIDVITLSKNQWSFQNYQLTSTGSTKGNGFFLSAHTFGITFRKFKLSSLAAGIKGANIGAEFSLQSSVATDGEVTGNTTGIEACGLSLRGVWVHDNTSQGYIAGTRDDATQHTFDRCVLSKNSENIRFASTLGGSLSVSNSTIADATGNGVTITSGASQLYTISIINSIIYGNGSSSGFGLNFDAGHKNFTIKTCAFGNNGSGNATGAATTGISPVTLTADPFTARGVNGDYSLNTTAGGGAACRAAGWPGALGSMATLGYADVGALQHQDAGTGGGATLARLPSGLGG